MSVSAIIVTRGDVTLDHAIDRLPREWEIVIWDNGRRNLRRRQSNAVYWDDPFISVEDLSVYGRYAAIKHATNELIYVQDDDCLLEDPAALVRFYEGLTMPDVRKPGPWVICNMPKQFRHSFYDDHALVGFGAVFHRDLPRKAFERFFETTIGYFDTPDGRQPVRGFDFAAFGDDMPKELRFFLRTCDIVFTGLSERVLVDAPHLDLPWASADNRLWKQPEHIADRMLMRKLMRKVRDA